MQDDAVATKRRLPRIVRFDEHTNVTRRRGIRVGWLLWKQDEPPYHLGSRSNDGTKRYLRFGVCL